MPHALLLSPDDQAVTAITDVLEEMSVTCERPLDGASAAQKLNSHSFDLVLVDCENLPAAKLIFDVCRRGKSGNNPVPIAIVDGRAGLPTAFRLGAELILTKPVAKDQARNTIRTAVSRVRKDVPASESVPAQSASPAVPGVITTSTAMPEERARAAAVSSQLTSFADPVPAAVPVASTKTLSAPAVTTTMHSAVDEIAAPPATPKLNPRSAPVLASSLPEASPARAVLEDSKPARLPSDDPVLAELEESELKESELKESALKSKGPGKVAPDKTAAGSAAPVSASYQHNQQKKRSPLVALLMLGVAAGGGLYAAWTYEPGFREIAQPQIDRVLALAGIAKKLPAAPNRVRPSTQPAAQPPAATSSAPAPESPTDPNQTQSAAPDSTAGPAATSDAAALVQSAAAPGTTVAKANSGAKAATAPLASKADVSKPNDSKKDAAAAPLSATQLPGEESAIILSSKGAEKRLAHSIQPKFPAEARSGAAQGTVVLKEVVDENGKVEGVRLVEGDAVLATVAIQAVKQWRYRPYVRNGKAQPFQTVVIIDFQRP